MLTKHLVLQLTEAREDFYQIPGNPSNNDIVCIHEALTTLLLQVGYDKAHAKQNLWGIIYPVGNYTANYGDPFATSKRIHAYPPISQEAIDQTRKLEALWKIHIKDYTPSMK